MTVYISGPMTGLPERNYPAFNQAELMLVAQGHEVLNPASLPDGLTYEEYMELDLEMVRRSQMVVTLPGWENSKGSNTEVDLARSLGIPVRPLANPSPPPAPSKPPAPHDKT